MKKMFILAALWLGFTTCAVAQELKIGDKVPDFTIGKIINYPKESLKFSDIKKRLVILDYWSTDCSPCISGMPHMDEMQKKFGNELLVLPVTRQEKSLIAKFWNKNRYLYSTDLPTIVEDKLHTYFPNSGGVGYQVWILDGKLFAVTNFLKVNEKEIKDVLAGGSKNWTIGVTTVVFTRDNETPLLKSNSKQQKNAYYSAISKADSLVNGKNNNFSDTSRSYTRVLYRNISIIGAYQQAYWFSDDIGPMDHIVNWPQRRILEIKDKSRFFNPNENYEPEWERDNNISYEAILPGKLEKAQMGRYMLADLNRLLGLNARFEKRKKTCMILTLKPGVHHVRDKIITPPNYSNKRHEIIEKFGYPSPELAMFDKETSKSWLYPVSTIGEIVKTIEYMKVGGLLKNMPPLVDESGYSKSFNISMELPPYPTFAQIKAELNKLGFDLKTGTRMIDMFVITENDWTKKAK